MFRNTAFLLAVVFGHYILHVDANTFLRADHHSKEERMSEEDVQTSLLAEIEGTFGEGSASSRVKQLESALAPMYAALPKNEKGYLGHSTVRYVLHRLFVQRHGWSIKGLYVSGGHRNSTSTAGVLKAQVPAYIQELFEKRLGGRGFGLHELGVLAATIEHLVHSEAIKRLGQAFNVHNLLPTSMMSEQSADDVLDTYMTSYILGEDLSNMTLEDAATMKADMPQVYMAWNETQEFVRQTRRNVTAFESSAHQQASGELDFSLVARVAERVGENFGSFQNEECKQIKSSLVRMEEAGTGRVRLSDFYKPATQGQWQFQESVAYLRELGALDESDARKPRVIIANYISSPSNCIASSAFYSVCCMDECEGLLGYLEREVGGPETTVARVAELVAQLPSSSIAAPRALSPSLLSRLEEIAGSHEGQIPLHGRLFAQWMHHAFPRECPYPHVSGTTNPLTPDEWMQSTGQETTATHHEMQAHVSAADDAAGSQDFLQLQDEDEPLMPWSPEEELLVCRKPHGQASTGAGASFLRNLAMVGAVSSLAYAVVQNFPSFTATTGGYSKSKKGGVSADKFLV